MPGETYHIGEVASRAGLSLRTVRYYEDVGLVVPSGRTEGGFRLYREADVQRLLLVRALKPTDLTVEEIAELLALHDQAVDGALAPEGAERLAALASLGKERLRLRRERLIAAELAVHLLTATAEAATEELSATATG